MKRILALCALVALPVVCGCSPSGTFWDRSPGARTARAPQSPTPYRQANRRQSEPRRAPRRQTRRYAPAQPKPAPRAAPRRPVQPQQPRAVARRGNPSAEDLQTLQYVNQIRQRRGLRPFRYNAQLFVAAFDHSAEQRRHGYMGHGSPDPRRRRLASRMKLAGYHGQAFAEVVAFGYKNVPGVARGWMNSTGHREILLDPKLQEAAFSRIGDYWTGNFGTPYPVRQPRAAPKPRTTRRAPAPAARPAPVPRRMPRFAPPTPSKPAIRPPPPQLLQPAPPRAPAPAPAPAPAARPAPSPSCGSPGLG